MNSRWVKKELGFAIHSASQITEVHRAASLSDVPIEP
jgi:hypothetical protein